jgi:VanZ family protein
VTVQKSDAPDRRTPSVDPPFKKGPVIAVAAVGAIILALTLTPADAPGGTELFSAAKIQSARSVADLLVNILLFLPLGAALASLWPRRWLAAAVAGVAFSAAIELTQLFVPGRYASPWDMLTNAVGTSVGIVLFRTARSWINPSSRLGSGLAASAFIAALTVLTGGSQMFAPARVPQGQLVGQWNHRFETRLHYEGRILDATVGSIHVPAWEVPDSDRLRDYLFGAPVHLLVEAGQPPDGPAPLFAIVAPHQQTLLEILADGDDVVIRYRMRAAVLGLDQPDVRVPGALASIAPGQVFRLAVDKRGVEHCVTVDALAKCHRGFSAADTWALLFYPVPRALASIVSLAWLGLLFFPAGFWLRGRREVAAAAILTLACLGIAALWTHVLLPAAPDIAGIGLGLLGGGFTRHVLTRGYGGHSDVSAAHMPGSRL